ncbi:MAG: tryptophan-rich sensory protein [Chloroflexi bacterium HGW-Chloroflexi-4]|nr:MAG: tryptophan-rich sensory protein [Chloroflexi bacterium HGW-Chloroflexi-4]
MNKRQFLNILGLLFALFMNYLANALPLNGISTGEISDAIPALFTPAGYVFAIWGIIYLGLIVFTIFQSLPAHKNNPRVENMGYWFFISNLLNGIWILFWHFGLVGLSVLVMLGLLYSLLKVYTNSKIGLVRPHRLETWALDIPFGIYLGWISVATIANISALGVVNGWNGFGLSPVFWTISVIIVGVLLAFFMIVRRKEIAYPLVLVWAFAGIFVVRQDIPAVGLTAAVAAAAIFVFLLGYQINRFIKKTSN